MMLTWGEWLSEDWWSEMNTETHRLSLGPQRSSRSLRARRPPRAWETSSTSDTRSTLWDYTDERVKTGPILILSTVLLLENRIMASDSHKCWNSNDAQMKYKVQLIHSGSQLHWVLCSLHAGVRTTDPLAPGRPSVPGLPCRLRESTVRETTSRSYNSLTSNIFMFNVLQVSPQQNSSRYVELPSQNKVY